ncbi:MAG: hypothetical protein A2Y63_03125 [Candidatus Riflebacteria bacterium RBG_13_59_9]|nr:MAG: hypothetical protein A2Y63_03125 [Candidatus Riflebacteria bacterium RBG_13_59_9]
MPIYEYKCTVCGHLFEVIAAFSANGTRKCKKCGAPAKRLISAPQVLFHGSGFYVTDHKQQNAAAEPAKSTKEGDSSTEKNTNTKKDASKAS